MRAHLFIFFMISLCQLVNAQEVKLREKTIGNGDKYILSKIGSNGKENLVIRNSNNRLFEDKNLLPKELGDSYASYLGLDKQASNRALKLITEAFSTAGRKTPKENIYLKIYIEPSGKILEIDFLQRDNSTL